MGNYPPQWGPPGGYGAPGQPPPPYGYGPPPHAPPPPPPRQPKTGGIGCGWWLIILSLGGCTIGACYAMPEIGWSGWGLMIAAWFIGRHLEKQQETQEAILEELRQQRGGYDDRMY